jgi:hypothetical protein
MTVISSKSITPIAVGRRDNSVSVEYSTGTLLRSHQIQEVWSAEVEGLPTVPYPPSDWNVLFFFSQPGDLGDSLIIPGFTINAPSRTSFFSEVNFSTNTESLWMLKFAKYATLDDIILDSLLVNPLDTGLAEEVFRRLYGYNGIHFKFTLPLPTELGKIYAFITRVLTQEPTWDYLTTISGLTDMFPTP